MFKLLRYYSIASLVAAVATAVLLTWFYRHVAVNSIVQLAEQANEDLARLALNPVKAELLDFLERTEDVRPGSRPAPMPAALARSISVVMNEEHGIARVKIYNRHGVVVFSTRPTQVGDDQSRNEGFIQAMGGTVGSELVYRDTFNSFDRATEEDNLAQTYVPVRAGPAEPIRGVFELYGDVNSLVRETERTQFFIMAGATAILSALYFALLLIVRHANDIIQRQQRTIAERNETLALLSARMLDTEESHKKKIAFDLHEGVAQTLAALKLKAEAGKRSRRAADEEGSPDSIIPMLQEAIQEVRAIATDLRPASLDDLGLLPTIYWLCREFEERHPGLHVERNVLLEEGDVPRPLKDIVYRIIMSVLGDSTQHTDAGAILLSLGRRDGALTLSIGDATPPDSPGAGRMPGALRAASSRMEALTTLSGGTFSASQRPGEMRLQAAWQT